MTKLLYVSGGMIGYPDRNFPEFNRVAEILRRAGYAVINPADKGIIAGWTWEQYLKFDLPQVLRCDGLAMLDGWKESRGARLEYHVAEELGIPCLFYRQWLDTSRKVY